MFWNIEDAQPKCAGVTECSRFGKEFEKPALLGYQNMNAQTIEILLFDGYIASKIFSVIDFRAFNTIVVTDSNWATVDHVD